MSATRQTDTLSLKDYNLELRQKIRKNIPGLIHNYHQCDDEVVSSILGHLEDLSYLDASLAILVELLDYIVQSRCSHNSEIMDFLTLMMHLPILKGSKWDKILKEQLKAEEGNTKELISTFDRLQLRGVVLDLGTEASVNISKHIEPLEIPETQFRLYLMNELNKSKLLAGKKQESELLRLWLHLISISYFKEGLDPAMFIVVSWVKSLPWGIRLEHKLELLTSLRDCLRRKHCPNAIHVLYELFSMPDHYVPAYEKYRIFKQLIRYPGDILNSFQLQVLYFFAGNYPAEAENSFLESIHYFKQSNYYLHRCWERMRMASIFLRTNLDAQVYFDLLPGIEQRVFSLGNQISLQNNAYVETLQADYSKIEGLYKQVEELSLTDSLTGLRNRRYLQSNIYHMIHLSIRHKVPICFAMIDIDHFKLVNDTYGHSTGDFILRELARLITTDFRKSDLIVRYGGEEFLMLLFDTMLEHAVRIMEEVRLLVMKEDFVFRGKTHKITISIGVSELNNYEETKICIDDKIAEADKALYEAKNSGRNCVRWSDR